MRQASILSLNSGSSSLKFGIYRAEDGEPRALYTGAVEGTATREARSATAGRLWIRSADNETLRDAPCAAGGQEEALRAIARALNEARIPPPQAIGHRVVHGGPNLREHQRITPAVIQELEAAAAFAPLHVPVALCLIRLGETLYPGVPQFACFDTAFHRTLPEAAARFALPEKFWQAGVRRYGFHGLSCESILHALGNDVPPRMIIAHLGSGASVTAIANGASVDTTMGLTPTGGIVMGTRPGDLDPGVLLYILRTQGGDAQQLEELLDRESGLLGISGQTGDMQELHQAANDLRARCAIEMFCRSVKKAIGSYVALLGGLDLLVFTGGIGEHDAAARTEICSGLEALGITLDAEANQSGRRQISASSSPARVCVVPSDEDGQIARHTYRLLAERHPP